MTEMPKESIAIMAQAQGQVDLDYQTHESFSPMAACVLDVTFAR